MKIDRGWYKKPNSNIPTRKGAGGVIVRKENNVIKLGLVRGDEFLDYILPKGKQEAGEDLLTTAKREIQEETGITDLKLITKLGVCERLTFKKDQWSVMQFYLFLTNQKDGVPTDPIEKYIVEWFDIDTLPEFFWPEQKEIIVKNKEKIKKLILSYKE